jgi:hypothetical protein
MRPGRLRCERMSFFEGLKLPSYDVPDDEEYETPEWWAAPRGWLGGVVPLQLLVTRSDLAAIYLSGLVAYPTGFALTIHTLTASAEARNARGARRSTTTRADGREQAQE